MVLNYKNDFIFQLRINLFIDDFDDVLQRAKDVGVEKVYIQSFQL